MPKKSSEEPKLKCVDDLRHAEYYGMQRTFDELYAKSKEGYIFTELMDIVLSRENILLAYRNIKFNTGSKTAGTDGLKLDSIGDMSPDDMIEKVRFIVRGSKHGYRPKPVRRKEIPKPDGRLRPLGIPCIWDRLIQQCIKQVMEPICEAKFYRNSFGFRPNKSVENAINRAYHSMQLTGLSYVIEFDIKGFFDNVDHTKLMRQIWAMGIRDKELLFVLKRVLKAPIKMPDGKLVKPEKGTPQGGIISPLLANIVLNELDWWVSSQWENNPVADKYAYHYHKNGSIGKGHGYRAMKGTNLKEMYIVRYADDFRIYCRTKVDAVKVKEAVTLWLAERLKLEVSPEKTRIVNAKKRYTEFLGFRMKLRLKGNKYKVMSRMGEKQLERTKQKLLEQVKNIANPRPDRGELGEVHLYNAMVMGVQNYYCLATDITKDARTLQYAVSRVLTNRLQKQGNSNLVKHGRALTDAEKKRYGKSGMLRYLKATGEPIYPIGYIKCKAPMNVKNVVCSYTPEGRAEIHDNLRINTGLMLAMMKASPHDQSVQFADNRISRFSAQYGKCAVTKREFRTLDEIHCHHVIPKELGGTDAYDNLVLVLDDVHRLIHATRYLVVNRYLEILQLDNQQLDTLNELRAKAGNEAIKRTLQS